MKRINARGHTTIIIGPNLFGPKKFISFLQKKNASFKIAKNNWQFLANPWILSINDLMVLAIFCQKKNGLEIFCQKTKTFLVKLWILSINKLVVLAMFFPKIVD